MTQNSTGRPESLVALSFTSAVPTFWFGIGAKEICCGFPFPFLSGKSMLHGCSVYANFVSPGWNAMTIRLPGRLRAKPKRSNRMRNVSGPSCSPPPLQPPNSRSWIGPSAWPSGCGCRNCGGASLTKSAFTLAVMPSSIGVSFWLCIQAGFIGLPLSRNVTSWSSLPWWLVP